MFGNECLGELKYEGTTSAIVMAGLFLSFVVEYIGHRIVQAKIRSEAALTSKERASAKLSSEVVNILVMEAGIIFHSLRKSTVTLSQAVANSCVVIGLTLVVSGDSFFLTLFVVILFHQVFEGLALGTRIATIGTCDDQHPGTPVMAADDANKSSQPGETSSTSSASVQMGLPMSRKLLLASMFAFVTPIGMAIGIGVLDQFNGNDPSTIVAIGTLDALSAGILVWVGVVEMWAGDWMTGIHGHKAELADADWITVTLGGTGLVAGLILMSVLGKWA